MNSNLMIKLWLFVFVVLGCQVNAQDQCPFPSKLKTNYDFDWTSKSNEWSNTKAATAFLQLVLSWTPTYCESLPQSVRNKEFQCINSDHFRMIVHGLWPQAAKANSVRAHPRNCRSEKQLNSTFVKRFYCMMPDEDLIQSQWEKHGSCHYKTPTEYYTTIEKLYKSLNIPNFTSVKNPTQTIIKNEFLKLNPKIFSSAIQVSMDLYNQLKEIKICYNLNHALTNCNS